MITIKTFKVTELSSLLPHTLICSEEMLKQLQSYYLLCGYQNEIKDINHDETCTFEKITLAYDYNNEIPITEKEKEIIDAFAKLYGLRRRKYYDKQGESFYSWEPPDGSGGEGM